jgi:hypothetical protein
VQPRFWTEFLCDGLYLSDLKILPEPIQPGLLADIEKIFGTTFFHGRFFQ